MANQRWRPLSARESGGAIDETLFEGVPDHLEQVLRDWLFHNTTSDSQQRIMAMTRTVGHLTRCPRDKLLDLVDALLYVGPGRGFGTEPRHVAQQLDDLLLDGGSVYRVAPDLAGLERRIDAEVREAAAHLMTTASTRFPAAAEHLGNAWKAAYGLHPNPAVAYGEAVKAVEAALIPVVQPNHGRATLGTVLGELRANPARWRIAINHGPDHEGDIAPFISMVETLWTGQTDRHASNGPTRAVSQSAAEGAIFLAIALVHWAQADIFERV